MKKKQVFGILLACMMTCLPAAEAMAANSYAVSAVQTETEARVLFPGDSITKDTETALLFDDGSEVPVNENGVWTVPDEGKVYKASSDAAAGSVVISEAGRVLKLEGGVSAKADGDSASRHYKDSQAPEQDPSAPTRDTAYYVPGEQVKLTADAPKEGEEFAGWAGDSAYLFAEQGVDASQPEITMSMPNGEVKLHATYKEAAPTTFGVHLTDAVLPDLGGTSEGTVEGGISVRIVAAEKEGQTFAGWAGDSAYLLGEQGIDAMSSDITLTMPNGDVYLTATYTETPQTESPQTEAPQTEAPQTEAPQTEAPQTEAPQTEAPQTEAPQTEAPQTEAPQTEAPQTETPQPASLYEVIVENGIGGGKYEAGSTVTIEANPGEGEIFAGWNVVDGAASLSDASQQVTTFTMPESGVTVEAEYTKPVTYKVQLENAVWEDGTADAKEFTADGVTDIKIRAKDLSADGLQFVQWKAENIDSATGIAEQVVFADAKAMETSFKMVGGSFKIKAEYTKQYKVTVANGLINGTSSEILVNEGEQITVTANPSPSGQAFANWKINDGDYGLGDAVYDTTINLTVTENLNILAVYEGIEYTVTVDDGSSNYDQCVMGTVVTITADKAPAGMEFDYWSVDTQNASLADAYSATTTFTMPEDDVAVTANYKPIAYTVSVENGYSDDEYYYAGDEVTIYSNYPANGRVFGGWKQIISRLLIRSVLKMATAMMSIITQAMR